MLLQNPTTIPKMTQDSHQPKISSLALAPIKFKLYYGTFVYTPALGELSVSTDTCIGVDKKGTIKIKKQFEEGSDSESNIDLVIAENGLERSELEILDYSADPNKFFFPGFIDTHIHAPQVPNNGIFGNTTLLEWLEKYTFPLEASFKDVKTASYIYNKVIDRTLTNGTTLASYYATIHENATKLLNDIAYLKGQRAMIGKTCMNQHSPDNYIETLDECKEAQYGVIKHVEETNEGHESFDVITKPIITPRFAGSCTEELMKWLGELSQSGEYHVQTHLSENHGEIKWIADMFPHFDSYADIYAKCNLLTNRTVLAHCIHISEEEKDLLVKHNSGISHCPTSNSSITSGEARIRWLLDNGVKVSLGTDCSGGFSPSILTVARHALLVSRHLVMKSKQDQQKLTTAEVLFLATVGGAQVLNVDSYLGKFETGFQFDAQLIDLNVENSPLDLFPFQQGRWQELLDKWLFNGDDRNTVKVFVNGRCVVSKV